MNAKQSFPSYMFMSGSRTVDPEENFPPTLNIFLRGQLFEHLYKYMDMSWAINMCLVSKLCLNLLPSLSVSIMLKIKTNDKLKA